MDNYKPYLLLVDDDEAITLNVLTKILKTDYEIKTATNGTDALALVNDGNLPDLILLDIELPDFNGFQIFDILNKSDKTNDIPIIFITGNTTPEFELHGLEKGAVDYISKPFSVDVVKKRIEQHLMTLRYQRSLELFKSLFDATSEGIMITDNNSMIESVNPAFTEITGYSAQEIVGKKTSFLSSKKNTLEFYDKMWKQLNETGKWNGEIWSKVKSGDSQIHNLHINTVYDKHGNPVRRIGIFLDITEKKKAEEAIWKHANFDSLTNLPNRRYFYEKLDIAIKKAKRKDNTLMALFFLDLDHFKEVNDTLGHEAGDELLIQSTARITKCVREVDTVSRLGGDEFTIILEEINSVSDLDKIAQNICHVLAEPFKIKDETVFISSSIGIAVYPNDSGDENGLLKKADQAMYQSKRKGRNCFSHYSNV